MYSTKIILTALAISTAIAACAINARAQEASQVVAIAATVEPSTVAEKPTYIDVLKSCGAKWKARENKKSEGNQGAAAWQAFRAMCVKDSGFVTKRSK